MSTLTSFEELKRRIDLWIPNVSYDELYYWIVSGRIESSLNGRNIIETLSKVMWDCDALQNLPIEFYDYKYFPDRPPGIVPTHLSNVVYARTSRFHRVCHFSDVRETMGWLNLSYKETAKFLTSCICDKHLLRLIDPRTYQFSMEKTTYWEAEKVTKVLWKNDRINILDTFLESDKEASIFNNPTNDEPWLGDWTENAIWENKKKRTIIPLLLKDDLAVCDRIYKTVFC